MYPFFKLDQQTVEDMEMFLAVEVYDPVDKYRNVQFILHLYKLFGMEKVMLFLTNFIYDDPEFFIRELLKQYKKMEMKKENYPYFGFK